MGYLFQKYRSNKNYFRLVSLIHHTTDKIPGETDLKKYKWQKKHLDNQTGTENSYSPIKIKKNSIPKKYETWK